MSADSRDPTRPLRLDLNSDARRVLGASGATISDEHARVEERWITLCAQAAVEQDPKKLLELVSEINRLLNIRKKRLAVEHEQAAPSKAKEK